MTSPRAPEGVHNLATQPNRFAVLDSLRGICAIFVAVFHFTTMDGALQSRFIANSWIFVDFFFVLSGFVISFAYAKRLSTSADLIDFAIRRLGRVWPLHCAMLILLIGLETLKWHIGGDNLIRAPFTEGASPAGLLSTLLLLHSTPVWSVFSVNGPSWSISAEYWTYLIFGSVVIGVSRLAPPRPNLTVVYISLWLVAFIILVAGQGRMETYAEYAVPRCLYGFAAGCLVQQFYQFARSRAGAIALTVGSAAEVIAVAMVAVFVIRLAPTPLQFLAPLVFGCAILIFAFQAGVISRLLETRPFLILGRLSFSIYMTHSFLREILRWRGLHIDATALLPHVAALALFLLAALILSAMTYRFVELPGQVLFRKIADNFSTRRIAAQISVP
jgi:hypothetical protein